MTAGQSNRVLVLWEERSPELECKLRNKETTEEDEPSPFHGDLL